MVAATVTIGVIGTGAWAHHMFTVGMGSALNTFFVVSTLLIAVPTGIKIFNWIATMYGGRIVLQMPMLCCIAFLGQFLVAGLTGIMLAVAPFDWQLHDTYFVVAHFHFVLIGGLVFTVFGAVYYWFPKFSGRLLSERLGRWHFWLFLVGFNLTFVPMHLSGMLGMARRIYTYPEFAGWGFLNLLSTLGVAVQGAAILIFIFNLVRSWRSGEVAGDDPWNAWTLEWATPSPPPEYNFEQIPTVSSRRPLWDLKHPNDPDGRHE
jgi:cytochrome c oxidase subunit 1